MSSPRKENGTTANASSVGSSAKESNNDSYQYVGPYRLEKTLGKGQTGKKNNTVLLLQKLGACSCLSANVLVSYLYIKFV